MSGRPVTVLLFLLIGGLGAPAASASSWPLLRSQALLCFQSNRLSACEAALLQAEALARSASSRSAYDCQTLLLGLQSDLIMQQLGDGRGDAAVEELAATARG